MVEGLPGGMPEIRHDTAAGHIGEPLEIECCPETHSFEKIFSSKKGSRAKRALTSVLRGCYLRAVLPGRIPELNRLDHETLDSGNPAVAGPGPKWLTIFR